MLFSFPWKCQGNIINLNEISKIFGSYVKINISSLFFLTIKQNAVFRNSRMQKKHDAARQETNDITRISNNSEFL